MWTTPLPWTTPLVWTTRFSHALVCKENACTVVSAFVVHAGGMGIGATVSHTLKQPQFLEDPHGAARTIWEKSG